MNRLSAIDAFSPAFTRVSTMLFQPFRLSTWLKMGFIGLLGGGLATANMNFRGGAPQFPRGQFSNDPMAELGRIVRSIHLADYLHLIMTIFVIVFVVALILLYFSCRFRFILFDSIISGQPNIGRGWSRYGSQANRYFGFWLVFRLVNWAVMFFIIGLPLWHAYQNGIFSGDNSMIEFLKILASIALSVLAAGIIFAVISTLVKDFVMPIMALDDYSLGDAWSALWRVVSSEPGAWAAYLGLKVVCAIATGIGLAIVGILTILPALLIIGVPGGLFVLLAVLAYKLGGLTAGMVVGCIAGLIIAAGIFCWICILTAPVSVFFASYAFYFFGGRYPKLGALLWPQSTPPAPQPIPPMGIQPAI
ncbi:MAG TPA: hypothetical protein VFB79_08500 [Candidatus Angelobacter sp.]|nr:hypothetical protein [Candidatus Angelobacter sp.]